MNNTVAYKDLCAGSVIRKPSDSMGPAELVVVLFSSYTASTRLVGMFVDAEEHVLLMVRNEAGVTSNHRVPPSHKVDLMAPFTVPEQTSVELGSSGYAKERHSPRLRVVFQEMLDRLDGAMGAEMVKDLIRKELVDGS
jgi:hypothetical protein